MIQLSVWEQESFFEPSDIIIVGSGFVGLWSAWYLKKLKPDLSITIVDRGIIPTGASTRNAGFACFGSLTELVANAREMGEDQMLELVEMRYKGLKKITKLFSEHIIGYERLGGYELIGARPENDINAIRSDIDRFNRLLKNITGQQKTFRLQNEKIADFGFAGTSCLIENRLEAQLHSGWLCQALLQLVQSIGVTVLNSIEVTGFEKINGDIHLLNTQNIPLSASQVLVCTNAFARQLIPDLDIIPARGQIILTNPIKKLPFKGTYHYEEGYYYFRNLDNRILLGGARNKDLQGEQTHEMSTSAPIQQELERFLREVIIPGRDFTIQGQWSGIMGMGHDRMPIIKQVQDNVFCAVRMSGMGVALAPVVGQKIAGLMTGKS